MYLPISAKPDAHRDGFLAIIWTRSPVSC